MGRKFEVPEDHSPSRYVQLSRILSIPGDLDAVFRIAAVITIGMPVSIIRILHLGDQAEARVGCISRTANSLGLITDADMVFGVLFDGRRRLETADEPAGIEVVGIIVGIDQP